MRVRLVQRALTAPKRAYRDRQCFSCGSTYWRRNLYEAWIAQNPGHHVGWRKVRIPVCTNCQDANRTMRGLVMVEANISRNHLRRTG